MPPRAGCGAPRFIGVARVGRRLALRDLAVVADADTGLLAPDVGPPGTLGGGTDDGAFLVEGLLVGLVWGWAELAVDFMLVSLAGSPTLG